MAQILDMAAANAGLKELYDDQVVENMGYDSNPDLAMTPKDTDAEGKYVPCPVIYETSRGGNPNFPLSQQNQVPMQLAEFMVPMVPWYHTVSIAQQAALASQKSKGGFVQFGKEYIDVGIQSAALAAALALFRSGTGTIGQVSTITAGVIVLTNPSDVSNFGIGDTLQANATDGGSPRAALGYVIARNVMSGTITVSNIGIGGAAGTPTGWTIADFLLVQGSNNALMSGKAAWLPATAPSTSDNFYGVNRSPDSRLYGLYYNGASQPIEEAIIDASMILAREKGKPDKFITNFGSLSALDKALQARREFVDFESEAGINFSGIRIRGANGVIDCFADRNCQAATGYLLQMKTWKLASLGSVPSILKYGDGMEMLRIGNQDALECRIGFYGNLMCRAPGWNSQVALGV